LTLYSEIRIYATMKIQTDIMHAAADQASELLKSLANRHRLLILCQLVDGERSVGDLAAFVGVRDSTVSQHLALLRKDGLVQARREGQTIYYAIASDPARQVLETLFAVYCSAAPICVEPAPEPKRRGQRRAA
jgi:ArsR family transcriptional regulator, virulence genes transcriptional regulator